MITVTFIRHGESMDNLKSVWAGWKDSPLSTHGMRQAQALGEYFANIHLAAIHASPLKRTHSTAQALYDAQQQQPKPPFTLSPLLREQHFGVAEGKEWTYDMDDSMTLEEHFEKGIYPVLTMRDQRFPEGESLNEVQARAEQAREEIIMPYIWDTARSGWQDVHIAIVSHGLFISELVAALMRKDATEHGQEGGKWKGLLNTAWTRVVIDIPGLQIGQKLEEIELDLAPLKVRVTDINCQEHLIPLMKLPGGVGATAYDPKQKDIRAFFGGGTISAEGRSASNALDEVAVEQK